LLVSFPRGVLAFQLRSLADVDVTNSIVERDIDTPEISGRILVVSGIASYFYADAPDTHHIGLL
jgi:hypothetical protein